MIPPLAKRASLIIWYQLFGSIAFKPVLRFVVCEGQDAAVFVGDKLRFVGDDGFDHRNGSWVKRTLHASEFTHGTLDLRNRVDRHVLFAQHIHDFTDRSVRHGGWH